MFHTPNEPSLIFCPIPSSIKNKGTPSRINIMKKGIKKAPETKKNDLALLNNFATSQLKELRFVLVRRKSKISNLMLLYVTLAVHYNSYNVHYSLN